jgi:diguanylate cyclase (GGDEF)-like protein
MEEHQLNNKLSNKFLGDLMSLDQQYLTLFGYYHDIEMELLACQSIHDITGLLLEVVPQRLELLSASLHLVDKETENIELLIADEDIKPVSGLNIYHNNDSFKQPYQGVLAARIIPADSMLAGQESAGQELLLLPLLRGSQLIGSLQYGLKPGLLTLSEASAQLLNHLSSVIAASLENCINQQYLAHLSIIDVLTKVKNRRGFDIDLLREVGRACRSGDCLSCLFIDIDFFKMINDSYGHCVGDMALQQVVDRIQSQLRRSDLLARYGGEEFAVLLPSCDMADALEIAERIRLTVTETMIDVPDTIPFRISVSVGVAACHVNESQDSGYQRMGQWLVHSADNALYQAKSNGRNQVCSTRILQA